MRAGEKQATTLQQDHSDIPQGKRPINQTFCFIRTLGVALTALNILAVGVPLSLGLIPNINLFDRVEQFSIATAILSPSFVVGVGLCILALIAFIMQKRLYVGTLLRWGIAVSATSFTLWVVVSLLTTAVAKPVIYLYPEVTTDVTVQLDYDGTLIADYPPYDTTIGGWQVTAEPDGALTNHADGKEYSYLFWEGTPATPTPWDLATGFVVKGSDTREFLQDTLAEIGLTPKEYNEFIVYWYPKMKDNPYNLIHFADEQYTDTAPLTITPVPDSMLRVFMVYKSLTEPIDVIPQTFTPFQRTGFTVVEWGGVEVHSL